MLQFDSVNVDVFGWMSERHIFVVGSFECASEKIVVVLITLSLYYKCNRAYVPDSFHDRLSRFVRHEDMACESR